MALLDKVKSQAKDLKGKVEGKVEDVQAKRKVDDLLDDLGRILYAERTERPMPDADKEISRIVDELKKLEDEGAEVLPAAS
jgi:CRISPR/Cas system type I-B associated protein Csh2 (Cas7 group RAMP superfamily)